MLARKALAGTAGTPKVYVEDVFSTYLYTGNASTQTITNNIDLSGKGGLVWFKDRSTAQFNCLFDTARGATKLLYSNSTSAQATVTDMVTSFNANGFSIGADASGSINVSGDATASWTFRKAEKFFDVVTYTGDNTSSKAISHNLGSVPGCVIVKRTDSTSHWFVWHRSTSGTPNNDYTLLNQTAATAVATDAWSSNAFTSTQFYVSNNLSTNVSGATYVAYVFAHDAGGFGDAGSDNVISCGSFTTDAGGSATVNLGYEPQWLLTRSSSTVDNWYIFDVMRGFSQTSAIALFPNGSSSEYTYTSGTTYPLTPTATGFYTNQTLNGSQTYIYIAIRRGPMKTPTDATKVFNAVTYTGTGTNSRIYTGAGFPADAVLINDRLRTSGSTAFVDRLRGGSAYLDTTATSAEATSGQYYASKLDAMDGYVGGTADFNQINLTGLTVVDYYLRRAPGFFDVVCYTGTGSARTVSHNLGVAPELIITKNRASTGFNNWLTCVPSIGMNNILSLNTNGAVDTGWSDPFTTTNPTSSVFSLSSGSQRNASGITYVAYLFASLSGVSKIGSYTGNGSSVTVTTNFQPRFILVKRTDSTGDWIFSDSARGLVAGNDPFLKLNSTAAEVTNEDWVDITSTSFTVNQTTNNANVNTGTYIYLAIA